MITPEPILMTNENGRMFEFELGRMEKVRKHIQYIESHVPPHENQPHH